MSLSDAELEKRLRRLVDAERLPLRELDIPPEMLRQLGFEVVDEVALVPDVERLDAGRIRAELSARARSWLVALNLFAVTGSTNTLLTDHAATGCVDGIVNMAELQISGRGRRGRRWQSPFGRNLAVSVGVALATQPARLGGFSLAIGLAVLDLLHRHGVTGLRLKWPNDVLLSGKKLAGILVEMVARPAGTELVIGVGLNLDLPHAALADIDQPVADLTHSNFSYSRNALAAGLVSNVLDYALGFAESGFAPMRALFDEHHHYHLQHCRILQGGREMAAGVVRGVTEGGELLLDTDSGLQEISAGEVSLRQTGQ
jgi:BirA family biotin operon repressor/biotin-[acetyl-CoA-carboxylase] ligase